MKTLQIKFGLALLLAALMSPLATAQIANSGEPIQVTADGQAEMLSDIGRFTYTQNVRAVQGNAELKSDRLTIFCKQKDSVDGTRRPTCSGINRILAEGNVIYATPEERIRGTRGEYDAETDTITITGDVILSRGEDGVARGAKVVYEISSGRATISSEGAGQIFSVFPSGNDG